MPPDDVTCGGDLSGDWVGVEQPDPSLPIPSDVDECWNLMLSRSGSALYALTWINYQAVPRVVFFRFQAATQSSVEPGYSLGQANIGSTSQTYAQDCLFDGEGTVTCEELATSLTLVGQGEGSVSNVACTSDLSGGCACNFDIQPVSGSAGTWQNPADGVVTLTPTFATTDVVSVSPSYCVDSDSLRFGAEIDALYPRVSNLVLERVNCADGVQGPGETGPDCGWVCPAVCP
jgi:hypothetical protein